MGRGAGPLALSDADVEALFSQRPVVQIDGELGAKLMDVIDRLHDRLQAVEARFMRDEARDAFIDGADASVAWRESDLLTVSPAAREIAGQIFSGAGMWLRPPQWYRAITASMLPPRLREAYGFSDVDRSQSERARAWLRRIYPTLPARLRDVGPYQEAVARLSGRASPDFATRTLNRLWIGRHRLAG